MITPRIIGKISKVPIEPLPMFEWMLPEYHSMPPFLSGIVDLGRTVCGSLYETDLTSMF